jgi:hypothetical protein
MERRMEFRFGRAAGISPKSAQGSFAMLDKSQKTVDPESCGFFIDGADQDVVSGHTMEGLNSYSVLPRALVAEGKEVDIDSDTAAARVAFAALHPNAGSVESACPQTGQPRHATRRTEDKFRIQRVASVAAAFLFAALAPALVMAALWHAAKIASVVFAFTFAIALYHAVFFGLPLFLVFRLKRWINVMSCVVSGFAVGAVPAGVLTWPMQHPELRISASVDGVATIINGVITAAGWVNYVKPLIYFGSFGALGGFAFWVALISAGIFGRGGGSAGHTRANGPASQTWVAPAFANNISTENASTVEPTRAFAILITNDASSPELADE